METLTRPRPDVTRADTTPSRRLGRTLTATGWAFASIALFALVALVLAPEGSPSIRGRVLALAMIAGAAGLAAAVTRWGPAWLRAAGLIVVGFAMVTVLAGVVADRAMRGLAIGTVLGLLAGVGGIVLMVAGWRRALRPIRRTWLRITAAVVGTLVVAQLLILPGAVALFATHRGRPEGSGRTPASVGLEFEEVRVPVDGGLRLAGWWVPSRNDAALVLLHGSGSTREDVLDQAKVVADDGYGALLLDLRGHGDSPGRLMDMGWGAEHDVRDAVSWTLERPGVERVGLLGLSMGGEIALTTARVDPRVGVVIAEGATGRSYADTRVDPDPNPIATAVGWLQWALIDVLSAEPEPVPLLEAIQGIEAPVLLIEGAGPNEQELGRRYAEAPAVTLWSVPDAPHIRALATHPVEYQRRVLGVLDAALRSSD